MYSYCSMKVKRELFITHAESLSVSMTADKQMQSSTQHTSSDETDWAKQDGDTVHQLDGFYGRQTSTQFNRFKLPECLSLLQHCPVALRQGIVCLNEGVTRPDKGQRGHS